MGCGTSFVKIAVFIFNLIFVLIGIALIAVGSVFKVGFKEITNSLGDIGDYIQLVPTTIIVIGCIIFFIAFLGCCGAIRESICMLSTYGVIMLVLFLLQVGFGTYAYIVYKNQSDSLKNDISTAFTEAMNKYGDSEVARGIDQIQKKLKCCGAISSQDWVNSNSQKVPDSCCVDQAGCTINSGYYSSGCVSLIFDEVQYIVEVIVIVVFTIAAVELATAIIAFCLTSCIRNNIRRGYY